MNFLRRGLRSFSTQQENPFVYRKHIFLANFKVPEWKEISTLLPKQNTNMAPKDSISSLLAAGLHFGHSYDRFHPNMLPYIYGRRSGIHVINLEHTLSHLRRAISVTEQIAQNGGVVLFVGNKDQKSILENCAKMSNQFYVSGKWLEGCLQNHEQTLKSVNDRFIQPHLIVVLDMKCEKAIEEASNALVPTIGLCDTDCDPLLVTYPIPGNDDSFQSVELVGSLLANAAKRF